MKIKIVHFSMVMSNKASADASSDLSAIESADGSSCASSSASSKILINYFNMISSDKRNKLETLDSQPIV